MNITKLYKETKYELRSLFNNDLPKYMEYLDKQIDEFRFFNKRFEKVGVEIFPTAYIEIKKRIAKEIFETAEQQ